MKSLKWLAPQIALIVFGALTLAALAFVAQRKSFLEVAGLVLIIGFFAICILAVVIERYVELRMKERS